MWLELGRRFAWYDSAASASRWCYQLMKIAALATGAAVTVLAAIRAPAALTASLAAAVVLLEGAQQVFQFHANWISYRATAETLREHRFLYAARVAPYDDVATRQAALAAFLRDLTTTENGTWSKTMSQTPPVASSSS